MNLRVMSILSLLSIFLFSSVTLSQDVQEGLDVKETPAVSGLEVLSPKKVIEPRVVKAVPLLQSAEEKKILEDLKEARLAGDRAAARALQSELDALHGILPNASEPADDEQEEVILEEFSQDPGFEWVDGDILINNPSYDVVKPAMASAPDDATLYVAMEDRTGFESIRIYQSTNNGSSSSWSHLIKFTINNGARNPSIAVTDDYIHVAYEAYTSDTNRAVRIYSISRTGGSNYGAYAKTGISLSDFICPEICTDYLDYYSGYYVYVTWAEDSNDYYSVFASRSTDKGQSFQTPINVTGGAENTTFATKPDIAYGTPDDDLFIAFVKLGWNGSSWTNQIWVTKSTSYGYTWVTPVQLTDLSDNVYHPRVSAAHGRDSVVVTYTREWTATDDDVNRSYSTDGGDTWNGPYCLACSSSRDEQSSALSVSNDMGRFHVAYIDDLHDIYYRSADTATPNSWSAGQLVNEYSMASLTYPRPTITVNPNMPVADEACIAWADYRRTWYDIYFDSASLIDYGDELAADFGSNGLWHYENPWTRKTTWNAGSAGIAGWAGGLAADFDANGLWNYNGTTWSRLTTWNPDTDIAGWTGGLAADFSTNGLWNYDGTTWSRLTILDAGSAGLAGWAGGLAADFMTNGLWNYDGTTWSRLTIWNPDHDMDGWFGGLAVDFAGNGLWNYNGTTWSRLTIWNPGQGGMAGWAGGLAADFTTNGLWNYDGTTWSRLTIWYPQGISALGDGVAADFGINGVWYYDGTTWSRLTTWSAADLTDVDLY